MFCLYDMLLIFLQHRIGEKHQLLLFCSFKRDTKLLRAAENVYPSLHGAVPELSSPARKQDKWPRVGVHENTALPCNLVIFFSSCHRAARWKGAFGINFSWWSPMIYSLFGGAEVTGGCALNTTSTVQYIPWKIRPWRSPAGNIKLVVISVLVSVPSTSPPCASCLCHLLQSASSKREAKTNGW